MDAAALRATLAKIPYTRELGLTLDGIAEGELRMTLPAGDGHRNLAGRVRDELAQDGRSELTVRARLAGDDGQTVAEISVDYAFRPLERP